MILKKIILVLNLIFEGTMGVLFAAYPHIVFENASGMVLALSRMFGFAAITMALLSFLVLRKRSYASKIGLITLAIFHWGILIATILNVYEAMVPIVFAFIHAIFALAFTYLAAKECAGGVCKTCHN